MVSTIDEARTPAELAEWLRVWADGYEEGVDYLDDHDARQLADAIERVSTRNAAAMREALEKCAELGDQIDNWLGSDEATVWNCRNERSSAHNIMLTARAALSAPARNCDRPECATAEGAIAALRANPCADHDFCKEQIDCAECATRWLIAPAEGGDHA